MIGWQAFLTGDVMERAVEDGDGAHGAMHPIAVNCEANLTNDIYTTEDADFLRTHGVLPDERIRADRPTLLISLRDQPDAQPVATWVHSQLPR